MTYIELFFSNNVNDNVDRRFIMTMEKARVQELGGEGWQRLPLNYGKTTSQTCTLKVKDKNEKKSHPTDVKFKF